MRRGMVASCSACPRGVPDVGAGAGVSECHAWVLGGDHRVRARDPRAHARCGGRAGVDRGADRVAVLWDRCDEAVSRPEDQALTRRLLGVPWLFAVAYSAVGFSLYFAIGVVADRGLGLTPLIFLAAGL